MKIVHSHTYALKLVLQNGKITSLEGHEIIIENVNKGGFASIFREPEHTDTPDL